MYNIKTDEIYSDTNSNDESISDKELILSLCTIESVTQTGSTIYTSETLQNYIPMCEEIIEISIVGIILYVGYTTTDGKQVNISYNENGIYERCVYDVETDVAVFDYGDVVMQYENYRKGTTVAMSDELLDEIDYIVSTGDMEKLYDLEDINVIESSDGTVAIEPDLSQFGIVDESAIQPQATGFSSESAMLENLKSNFPPYTKKLILNTSGYCNALSKNIFVRVRESREVYTKKTADFKSYAFGATLIEIGTFLSLPTSVVELIILGMNIALNEAGYIEESARICKSAAYTYTGRRMGYVYDSTIYKDYVNVISYDGKGEFHGGYDGDEVFRWIHFLQSDAYDKDSSTIANKALTNYNACIVLHGTCEMYEPD